MQWNLVHFNFYGATIILLLLLRIGYTLGRRHCYSCSTLEIGSTCLHVPANVTTEGRLTVPCKYYCTIWRQEYVYIPESYGLVVMNRSCEKQPERFNGIEYDDYFITHYRSCRSHLCNSGDGLERIPITAGEEDEDVTDRASTPISALSLIIIVVISSSLWLTATFSSSLFLLPS